MPARGVAVPVPVPEPEPAVVPSAVEVDLEGPERVSYASAPWSVRCKRTSRSHAFCPSTVLSFWYAACAPPLRKLSRTTCLSSPAPGPPVLVAPGAEALPFAAVILRANDVPQISQFRIEG